jgi:PIN domain nuclease of toxin-antitoxin system
MRLLLDTQAIIWYVDQDHLLSTTAHVAITDPQNDLLVSAATIWEIAIKVAIKKLSLSLPYRQWMTKAIADLSLTLLPITVESADVLTSLPHHHGDPFDRLIIAQSITDGVQVVSADAQFDSYGISRLW